MHLFPLSGMDRCVGNSGVKERTRARMREMGANTVLIKRRRILLVFSPPRSRAEEGRVGMLPIDLRSADESIVLN